MPPPPIITKVKGKGKQLSKQNSEIRVGLLKTELYAQLMLKFASRRSILIFDVESTKYGVTHFEHAEMR